jgi:topoisomerase-4 subunit B
VTFVSAEYVPPALAVKGFQTRFSIMYLRKGTHLEVTRFKGLGEISPKEFGQFIGENMRAVPVGVEHTHEIPDLLNFYMGNNTADRRRYIMENLV